MPLCTLPGMHWVIKANHPLSILEPHKYMTSDAHRSHEHFHFLVPSFCVHHKASPSSQTLSLTFIFPSLSLFTEKREFSVLHCHHPPTDLPFSMPFPLDFLK